jgi:hypothetical protein
VALAEAEAESNVSAIGVHPSSDTAFITGLTQPTALRRAAKNTILGNNAIIRINAMTFGTLSILQELNGRRNTPTFSFAFDIKFSDVNCGDRL